MNFRYYFILLIQLVPFILHAKKVESIDGLEVRIAKSIAYSDETRKNALYTEYHEVTFKDGKVQKSQTVYRDTLGNKIAEMRADYTRSIKLPTYIFRDFRNKEFEGLKLEGSDYMIFRKKKGELPETKKLEEDTNIFSAQGWHYYLMDHLETIGPEGMVMSLLFPARLDYYELHLQKKSESNGQIHFHLEFNSWIMSLFAPSLDLIYDLRTKKLLQYSGPSNILDVDGDTQDVVIIYD